MVDTSFEVLSHFNSGLLRNKVVEQALNLWPRNMRVPDQLELGFPFFQGRIMEQGFKVLVRDGEETVQWVFHQCFRKPYMLFGFDDGAPGIECRPVSEHGRPGRHFGGE